MKYIFKITIRGWLVIDTDAKNAISKIFVCLYILYRNKNYLTDFNETWYSYSSYSWAGHSVLFITLQSVGAEQWKEMLGKREKLLDILSFRRECSLNGQSYSETMYDGNILHKIIKKYPTTAYAYLLWLTHKIILEVIIVVNQFCLLNQ